MFKFANDVRLLPGRHRTHVFALLIAKLVNYSTEVIADKELIRSLVSALKKLFHNHEQHFVGLQFILRQSLVQYRDLSLPLRLFLDEVIATLNDPEFKAYFIKKAVSEVDVDCAFQRQFESHVAVNLLVNPSKALWESVNRLSASIICLLESNTTSKGMVEFLNNLGPLEAFSEEPYMALAFGRFAHQPLLTDVIEVLKDQDNLATVMLIHFMFMRDVCPYLPISGYCSDVADYAGDFKDYLSHPHAADLRLFFFLYPFYAPHLYTDRGRAEFHCISSTHLGITRSLKERAAFPSTKTAWFPDCLSQQVNLDSPYAQSLIQRDIPYVAGPSGMTSVFCGGMVLLGQLQTIEAKNYYILAIMAFITSGGLHSIHEVLTIPQTRLGLLKNYQATGPQMANYDVFFNLFHRDEMVMNHIRDAWVSTIDWISQEYPHLLDITPAPARPGVITRAVDCMYHTVSQCFF